VVVEVQSAIFHSSLTDQRRDRERFERLRRAGWSVVEISDDEVWNFPDRVVEKVRRARGHVGRPAA
jgi:very-short-patch-repair endonuclease